MKQLDLLNHLLREQPDLIWAQDRLGRYVACSAAFAGYVGLPEALLIGLSEQDLSPEARLAVSALYDPAAGNGSVERWLTWPDGRRSYVAISITAVAGDEGGLIGVARNITALHTARVALSTQQTTYHALFQTLVHGLLFHAADGRIVDANPAAAAILGLSLDQIGGRTALDPRWHAIGDDGAPFPDAAYPAMAALRTGRAVLNTTMGVFNPLKGAYVWLKVGAVPLFRPDEDTPIGAYTFLEDMTEQRRAQEELAGYRRHLEDLVVERTAALETVNRRLRRSDMRLQAMFDLSQRSNDLSESELLSFGINEAVRLTDSVIGYLHFVHENQEEIELAAWSEGALELCSATYDKHYPVSIAGVWAESVRTLKPVIHNDFASLTNRRGYPEGHTIIERHMGVPVVEGGRVRLLIGVGNKPVDYDETDERELWRIGSDLWRIIIRRRVEYALRESEGRYRALFQSSTEAIALIDQESGRFIDCNDAAIAFFDTGTRESLVGLRPEDLSPLHQLAGVTSETLAKSYVELAAHEGEAVFEWIHRRHDGTLFPALISLSQIKFRGKDHLLVVGRDISELKRYQAELEQARDAAEAANRAKSAFLANMSHELRTPLSAILGRAELLREEIYGPLTERQRTALETMESSGAHLLELISDLLDLSKIEAGQITLNREPVVVEALCQTALQAVRAVAATKDIALSFIAEPDVDLLVVDPRRFQQILVNLLANAVKFTPESGRVELVVSGDVEAQQALFTVVDTGIGIAPEDLIRLFKPFVQVDTRLSRTYDGSGLGLALVLRLAELHGGSVRVESNPGVGSRFSIVVPWEPTTRSSLTIASPETRPVGFGEGDNRLVLVAEDNPESTQLLLDYLPILGYRCVAVQNGAEAVARARELQPDVILMDIQMPVLDGLTAIRQIRTIPELRTTPIIALTALAMTGDHERCLAAGANAYLTKPILLRQVRTALGELLGFAPP